MTLPRSATPGIPDLDLQLHRQVRLHELQGRQCLRQVGWRAVTPDTLLKIRDSRTGLTDPFSGRVPEDLRQFGGSAGDPL